MDEVSDRAPILNSIIEKWKFFIKTKKSILDRYFKNSFVITDAFEKMAKFLGIDGKDRFDLLPVIIGKMEAQIDSIQKFISQLTEEQNILEDERKALESRITEMKVNKSLLTSKR